MFSLNPAQCLSSDKILPLNYTLMFVAFGIKNDLLSRTDCFVDEAGFNFTFRRIQYIRNIIGQVMSLTNIRGKFCHWGFSISVPFFNYTKVHACFSCLSAWFCTKYANRKMSNNNNNNSAQ